MDSIDLFPTTIKKGAIYPSEEDDRISYDFLSRLFSECDKNSWTGETGLSTGQHNLTLYEHEELKWFYNRLHGYVQQYWNSLGYRKNCKIFLVSSWANHHQQNDTTAEHSHSDGAYGGNHISGVYYFRKPETDGHITFCDPIDYIRRLCPYERMFGIDTIGQQVLAEQYEFILFPSWMRHRVERYNTQKERIAISFNYRGYW